MSLSIYLRRGLKPLGLVSAIQDLSSLSARRILPISLRRLIYITKALQKGNGESHDGASACELSSQGGSLARTDSTVQVEYPKVGELPPSGTVRGRGGRHFKRTLPTFSLEGRVGVVTGGARGLGLVMSQALVISGANIAIVDLNSMFQFAGLCSELGNEWLTIIHL